MKKLLVLILSIIMLFVLVACGNNDSKKDEENTKKPIVEQSSETEYENTDEVDNKDGEVVINELSGKTLKEVIDAGYKYSGYMTIGDNTQLFLRADEITNNDAISKLTEKIKDMTVSELVDEYDVYIGYIGANDEYIFTADIGSVSFSFDLENGVKALEAHKDETFFDFEDANEIKNDKLENLKVDCININADLDEESSKKLSKLSDIDNDTIESMATDITISKVYYTVE